ncbi:MAG: hypothetical protein IPM71_07720 [Bacteroidota bacterium]|nr:MAG: hypothetical protein IPM71_07720 [Bacteroidota bacterium]
MKKIFTALLLLLILSGIKAQSDTFETIGNPDGKAKVRGFMAPLMCFTRIDDEFVHMMGGGGAVVINNFFFGGYGMGKTTQTEYRGNPNYYMTYGHGGLWMGYTFKPHKAIHPVLHTQMGWGKIGEKPKDLNSEPLTKTGDLVYVIVPTLELEMNFSYFFKLGAGINYQFFYNTGEIVSPYTASDFASPGVFVSLKFGWFR